MKCARCFFYDAPEGEHLCEHCARNTTPRELVWLALIIISYAAVSRFGHYLFSGMFFTFRDEFNYYYRHVFTGPKDLMFPVDIAQWEAHGLMIGLVFAFMSVVPVITAVLYGAWAGVLTVLLGAGLSPFAYFSVAGTIGSLIAGSHWSKMPRKEISALLGLVPCIVYFALRFIPRDGSRFDAVYLIPLGVFVVFSVLLSLYLVRSAQYRNWRATTLVVMTPLAGVVFFVWLAAGVGFDRLEYVVIANKMGISGDLFNPRVSRRSILGSGEAEKRRWQPFPGGPGKSLLRVLNVKEYFDRTRERALSVFFDYVGRYSTSPLCPLALYDIAELLNAKLDIAALKDTAAFSVYTDRIASAALQSYNRIRRDFHNSPITPLAYLKTAEYYYQHGDFISAVKTCRDLIGRFESKIPTDYDPPPGLSLRAILTRMGTQKELARDEKLYLIDYCCRHAHHMVKTIENNDDYDGEPLRKFARLDSHAANYASELEAILSDKAYEGTKLADNLRLAILTVTSAPDVNKLGKLLEQLTGKGERPTSDVIDGVLYYLAEAYYLGAFDNPEWLEKARGLYSRLIAEYPDSIYYVRCKARLIELDKPRPAPPPSKAEPMGKRLPSTGTPGGATGD